MPQSLLSALYFVVILATACGHRSCFGEDAAWTVKGERLVGVITGGQGVWKIGNASAKATDVLVLRFSDDPSATRMASGVFLRGGSLLGGSLASMIGTDAEVVSNTFGALKLQRDDIAGAFSPPSAGQADNLPALSHYTTLAAATLGAHSAEFAPGVRNRIRFAGQDELIAEKVMRVGAEQILLATQGKGIEAVERRFVRLLELSVPPSTPPTPDDEKQGPELIVRLKNGDLLRGRVVRLTDQKMVLRTAFMGEKEIDRAALATAFLAGGTGTPVTWLAARKPASAVHTPTFDADFPVRMDASVDGDGLAPGGFLCERGIGVHSRTELTFSLDSAPKRFFALCGLNKMRGAQGEVVCRVLADGKEVWTSGALTAKDGAKPVALDIGTAKSLTLITDFGPGGDDVGDHVDWGWAAVITK